MWEGGGKVERSMWVLRIKICCAEGMVHLTATARIDPVGPHVSCAHRILPDLKGLRTYEPIGARLHQMATETTQILCETMARENPLSLNR